MTTHTVTPTAAATRRRMPARQAAAGILDSLATPTDPAPSLPGGDRGHDAAALLWDLTVHQLHQVFTQCLGPLSGPADGGQTPPAATVSQTSAGLAGVRLAATRHAVEDILDALCRMSAGTYGTCQRCARRIDAERLRAAPTTRWCLHCQAYRCI